MGYILKNMPQINRYISLQTIKNRSTEGAPAL